MTTTQTNFRTQVFKRAYEIMKATGKAFAVCLSKAWAIYRLSKKLLSRDEVRFTYKRTDGSLRHAYGTLRSVGQSIKRTGKATDEVFRYFDLEVRAVRCFKSDNLITVFN